MTSRLEKAKRKYIVHFYQSIRNIAFVCLIREENFDKMGLIKYNLSRVSECLKELYREEWLVCWEACIGINRGNDLWIVLCLGEVCLWSSLGVMIS